MIDTVKAEEALAYVLNAIPGVLWGGTLLGMIRENRILPYDNDVDIAISFDEFSYLDLEEYRRAEYEPWMNLYVENRPHGNVGYLMNDIKIGIHLLMGSDDFRYYTRYSGELVKVPNPYPINYKTNLYPTPNDSKNILEWLYGDYWFPREKYINSEKHIENQQKWLVKKPDTVFCDGVWDLFHKGHESLLLRARGYGKKLVVGVKSDKATFTQKGIKPEWSELERLEVVKKYADEVFIYDNSCIKGDVFVHGEDWVQRDRTELINEAKNMGVPIVLLPRTPEISSTRLRSVITS